MLCFSMWSEDMCTMSILLLTPPWVSGSSVRSTVQFWRSLARPCLLMMTSTQFSTITTLLRRLPLFVPSLPVVCERDRAFDIYVGDIWSLHTTGIAYHIWSRCAEQADSFLNELFCACLTDIQNDSRDRFALEDTLLRDSGDTSRSCTRGNKTCN